MYKVMIVENQAMPRQLMESVINQSDEFECVYSIESSAMAEVYCMNNNIDLILMDICTAMNESGLVAAKEIKIKYPKIKIIMITSMPEYTYLERAREANVESFWYKEISNISILEVMQRTMNGESVYPDSTPVVELGNAKSIDFTDKELEVLKQLTSGDSDTEIAQTLNMSVWTVRTHVKHLLEKTGFTSRTRLAVAARESGIVILGY